MRGRVRLCILFTAYGWAVHWSGMEWPGLGCMGAVIALIYTSLGVQMRMRIPVYFYPSKSSFLDDQSKLVHLL